MTDFGEAVWGTAIRFFLAGAVIILMAVAAKAIEVRYLQIGPNCAPRKLMADGLASRFGEAVTGIGMTKSGHTLDIVELFVSSTGSWSWVQTNPEGLSCIVKSGDNWETVPFKPGQKT